MANSVTARWVIRLSAPLAAIAGLAMLSRPASPVPAQVERIDVVYGDPFAVDWQPIGEPLDTALSPMMSVDSRCIGFARSDWEGASRQPSLARCLPDDGPDPPDTVGVRVVAAGADTWRFLFFATPIRTIDLEIDGRPTDVASSGTIAAAVTPTDAGPIVLTWSDHSGRRYRAELD